MSDARAPMAPSIAGPLIEAKLAPPHLRRGILPRPSLLDRLLATRDGEVVALLAPAGYGKSTTLALWRSRERRPFAWLTVDVADGDPIRFLHYLAEALDRAIGLDPATLDLLAGRSISALSTGVPRLATALHRRGEPLVIALDDIHLLEGTPTADVLAVLVDYLPPSVTLALSGRSDAGLPTARLRAGGRLLELTAAELALDEAESGELIALLSHQPGPDEARLLHEKTEGWPAAVYLAGRRSTGAVGAPRPDVPVSGRDRDIGAYIDGEVLGRLSPRTRDFLVRTSVLDRLTGELCDAVVDRRGSDAILRRLASTNQLVMPLDAEGEWYRYHTLLREHLGGLLRGRDGDAGLLHRRAAAWYMDHGAPDLAIDHLIDAGELDEAAALVTPISMRVYREGRKATLERWLGPLGDEVLRRHPHLAAVAALAFLLQGRVAETDRMADLMDSAEYGPERPAGAEAFEGARATVAALMARRGFEAAVADAERAVTLEPRSSEWAPTCRVVLGAILATAGDPRADEVLRESADVSESVGAARAHVSASTWRALVAIEREDWIAADALVGEGLAALARYGYDADMTTAAVAVTAARAALHHGEIATARQHLAGFHVARPALGTAAPWFSVRCLLEASRAHLGLADPAGARALLQQAEDIIARRHDLGRLPADVAALRTLIRTLPPGPGGASTLTPSELRVLRLLPTYLSAPQMAERLYVSQNTVRTQMQAIYGKLGASSRAEAVERAIEVGLLEPLPALATARITDT